MWIYAYDLLVLDDVLLLGPVLLVIKTSSRVRLEVLALPLQFLCATGHEDAEAVILGESDDVVEDL